MSEPEKGRVLGRRRRPNAAAPREKRYSVYVTVEEDVQLRARAAVLGVTVPRLLVESAMSDATVSLAERRQALTEVFLLRNVLGSIANNVNQIARFANREGHFEEQVARAVIGEFRAMRPRINAALDALSIGRAEG